MRVPDVAHLLEYIDTRVSAYLDTHLSDYARLLNCPQQGRTREEFDRDQYRSGSPARGLDVWILDTDKQSTAQNWRASGADNLLPVFGVDKATNLESTVKELADAFDVAAIDGGAHLQEMHAAIIKVSDLVLIPVQPSPGDIWPAETIVELIRTRQKVANSPQAAFVINRRKHGTRLGRATEEALEGLGLPVWEGTVDRVVYAEALGNGISVVESGDEKAAAEVETLTDSIINVLSTNGRR